MPLTPEHLTELRRIAEAATPGPWAFPHQKDPYGCYLLPLSENNASYIAAFDPTTALELLDALAAARAEAERWKQQYEALRAEMERLQGALNISPDDVGRIMHESWSRTKRSQGFHHPSECPNGRWVETAHGRAPCPKCHADLIPWDNLPEPQKDINRHAFDDVLAEIRRRAAIAERGGESG